MWLAVAAAVLVTLALQLRPARNILLSSPYPDARNLTVISRVPFERYEALGGQFTGAAFYRPTRMRLGSADLTVALASPNLFEMLGRGRRAAGPSLVLSDAARRTYFNADADIVGRPVHLAGKSAIISAVIPNDAWRLPGRIDAWLLDAAPLPGHSTVFVLARLRDPTLAQRTNLYLPGGGRYPSASLDRGPFFVPALAMILVAILLVAITTHVPLGEYPADRYLRRWGFLAGKIVLLAPLVVCGSLVAGACLGMDFQPHAMLAGSFLGLRWALLDQRNRCPVCLRLLNGPTRIGGASHAFLEWYGTELVCARGHGLLYIPEIPSSSYWAHRWQYLDPSWNGLFSYAGAPRVRSRYG
jgi:hypothetical protein